MSDAEAYAINGWDGLFEVNAKNGEYEEGQTFRKNGLRYVRYPCEAGPFARQLEAVRRLAGAEAPYVTGIFMELARIVATNPRRWREGGIIRFHDVAHTPATFEQLADLLDQPPDRLRAAIDVLTDPRVDLMRKVVRHVPFVKQQEGISGKAGKAGNSQTNETRRNETNGDEDGDVYKTKTEGNEDDNRIGPTVMSEVLRRWKETQARLQQQYPGDKSIQNFCEWFHLEILKGLHPKRVLSDIARIELHAKDSQGKDKAVTWFLSAIQRPRDQEGLAYVPPSKRDKAA